MLLLPIYYYYCKTYNVFVVVFKIIHPLRGRAKKIKKKKYKKK